MQAKVSEAEFEAWAERIGLADKLRRPLRLVYCDRRTPTWAARECGISPSTVTRAVDKYPFGQCPCCAQPIPFDPVFSTWPGKEEGAPCPPIIWAKDSGQ